MCIEKVLPTGFKSLDQVLDGGFHGKSLNFISARPGMGKTSFALQLAVGMAKHNGKTVYYYNGCLSGDLRWRIARQQADNTDISKKQIIIDYAYVTPCPLRERLSLIPNLGAVIVDDIEGMYPNSCVEAETRERDFSSVIQELKSIAVEFDIPVIGIAGMIRSIEWRDDKRPTLRDFLYYHIDATGENSDTVLLLYRDRYYYFDADLSAEIIIAKNNYGTTNTLHFHWSYNRLAFSERTS